MLPSQRSSASSSSNPWIRTAGEASTRGNTVAIADHLVRPSQVPVRSGTLVSRRPGAATTSPSSSSQQRPEGQQPVGRRPAAAARQPAPQDVPPDLPSVGSAGHFAGTCVPCKFVRGRRGCLNGFACNLCHHPHPELTYSGVRRAMKLANQARMSARARLEQQQQQQQQQPAIGTGTLAYNSGGSGSTRSTLRFQLEPCRASDFFDHVIMDDLGQLWPTSGTEQVALSHHHL